MKKLLGATLAIFSYFTVYSQQDVQFTQFMNNKLFYNPGVAGSSGSICINGVHRTQWAGFENAPQTQNVNAEVPIEILRGALILNITNDQIGFFQDITAGIGYAYQLDLGVGTLGLGLELDFRNKQVTSDKWITPDGTLGDNAIPFAGETTLSPDLSFGAYFQSPKLWAGISSTRLLGAEYELGSNPQSKDGVTRLKSARHYFIMAGYNWEIPNTGITLMPAVLAKTDLLSGVQADINVSALYNKRIWGGVSYRLQDAVSIMAGYYIFPELRLTYAYDLTTSALRNASSGSHEIMLNYCFTIEIPPREKGYYRNPLFL
jgi:type IX secretion system PorP/SprF family membrane protein